MHERRVSSGRLHPRDDASSYETFSNVPRVIIEKPFRSTVKAGDGMAIDVTTENQQHLADTLRYSDVVVQVSSASVVASFVPRRSSEKSGCFSEKTKVAVSTGVKP